MNAKPLKTALVTGAAQRIGRAIALDLAAAGWAVGVHYNRSADEAAGFEGPRISAVDACTEAAIQAASRIAATSRSQA